MSDAERPGDQRGEDRPVDPRPKPRYGEYAPEGWSWTPPGADAAPSAPEPTAPGGGAPGSPAAAPPPPTGAPRSGAPSPGANAHPVDRVVSYALLAVAVLGVISSVGGTSTFVQQVQTVYRSFGIGDFDPPAWLPTLIWVSNAVQLALFVVVLIWTIRRIRAGRLAFWVPLAGGLAAWIALSIVILIVLFSDPAILQLQPTPTPVPGG